MMLTLLCFNILLIILSYRTLNNNITCYKSTTLSIIIENISCQFVMSTYNVLFFIHMSTYHYFLLYIVLNIPCLNILLTTSLYRTLKNKITCLSTSEKLKVEIHLVSMIQSAWCNYVSNEIERLKKEFKQK